MSENVARSRQGLFARFRGPIRRSGMIVFKSEYEEVSLGIDREGNVSVNRGPSTRPDLLLEGPHESFLAMFSDERRITEIPRSIDVRIGGMASSHNETVQQTLRDGAAGILRYLFE
jgi:hypothetical protein